VTRLRAGRSWFDFRQELGIFLFATASRPALGPTQPPIRRVPAVLSRGVKLTTHLYLVPRSENAWSFTFTPPIRLHGVALGLKKAQGQLLPLCVSRLMRSACLAHPILFNLITLMCEEHKLWSLLLFFSVFLLLQLSYVQMFSPKCPLLKQCQSTRLMDLNICHVWIQIGSFHQLNQILKMGLIIPPLFRLPNCFPLPAKC
jgi:hypothetical protein